jgi:hypothetical protein
LAASGPGGVRPAAREAWAHPCEVERVEHPCCTLPPYSLFGMLPNILRIVNCLQRAGVGLVRSNGELLQGRMRGWCEGWRLGE